MDCFIRIAGLFGNQAFAFINEHIGYLYYYESNIEKLEIEFGKLEDRRIAIQRMVDDATRQRLAEASNEVQTWLEDVSKIESEVMRISDEASMISTNCFLNINMLYKLGRDAANHVKTIDDLLKPKFDRVACERPPPSTTDLLLYNEGFVIFDSRESRVKKILEALKYEAVHLIGLWGMPGVGKTMLVKDIAKQAKKQSLFGEVVMVTVSQNIDLKRIQTVMAESLGLVLTEESVEVRAIKLAEKLATTQNKILVILDDLWETLDLPKVGIQLSQMAATCKVVITTRNKHVCDRMRCQEIVELTTLSDEESWSLFTSRAGDAVESSTIRELACNVAKECAGLPLALVLLGTSLKGKNSRTWEAVLTRLKRANEVELPGVSKNLFQSIKVSFDFLDIEAAKSCFLHCCVYTEDYEIPKEELMHMMVGGHLLANVETLNEAQCRVDSLLDLLKDCGLLLQGRDESYVKMHDVVRDAAIQISAEIYHAFYASGQGLTEWPRTTKSVMRKCRRLSLMNNDIKDLPPDPKDYQNLEMLILRGNKRLSSIPEMFFLHMRSLTVLDLSSTGIKSLPESFSFLTNLKVLNLGNCGSLRDISHINGLKKLAILILEGCPVLIAPKAKAWAKNLRFVNLGFAESHLFSLDIHFSKILPSCRRLEQLSMKKFVGSFQELISLRHLTRLFIFEVVDFDNSLSHEIVLEGSWPERLLKFDICFLERRLSYLLFSSDRRVLQLKGTGKLAYWVKELLKNTVSLLLAEFPQTELNSDDSEIPLIVFTKLEHLQIVNWANLEVLIWSGGLIVFLHQLKYMTIDNCPRLIRLQTLASWENTMPKLEELRVTNCPVMKELLQFNYELLWPTKLLPSLKILELYGLHNLSQGVLPLFVCLPNLKDLKIQDCGVKCVLSFSFSWKTGALRDPLPKLAKLHIENCPEMIEIIFVTDVPNASLQARCCFKRLTHLTIESCPRLSHLFSYKQAISMQHLSRLYIRDCVALGAVVISKENEEEASSSTHVADHEFYNSPFPNLRDLILVKLPQLTAFHHPTAPLGKWLHITSCNIEGCPKLEELLESRDRLLRPWMKMKKACDLSLNWYPEDEDEAEEDEEELDEEELDEEEEDEEDEEELDEEDEEDEDDEDEEDEEELDEEKEAAPDQKRQKLEGAVHSVKRNLEFEEPSRGDPSSSLSFDRSAG